MGDVRARGGEVGNPVYLFQRGYTASALNYSRTNFARTRLFSAQRSALYYADFKRRLRVAALRYQPVAAQAARSGLCGQITYAPRDDAAPRGSRRVKAACARAYAHGPEHLGLDTHSDQS